MLIVDPRIHFGKGAPSRPHRPEPYSAEEAVAAMDQAGVDRALIHPVLWAPDSSGLAMQAEWMTDGSLDWLWPAAERAGVPVSLAAALFLPSVGEIADILGRRHHSDAVLVAAMRDGVHRGIAVAQGPRPRSRHGGSGVQLGGLETSRLSAGGNRGAG